MTPLAFVLGALACYRLALLVVADTLTEPPREAVIRGSYRRQAKRMGMTLEELASAEGVARADHDHNGWKTVVAEDDHPPKVAYLLTCAWCSSTYLAGPVAAAAFWAPDAWWFQVPAGLLAFSAVAGFLASHASP